MSAWDRRTSNDSDVTSYSDGRARLQRRPTSDTAAYSKTTQRQRLDSDRELAMNSHSLVSATLLTHSVSHCQQWV